MADTNSSYFAVQRIQKLPFAADGNAGGPDKRLLDTNEEKRRAVNVIGADLHGDHLLVAVPNGRSNKTIKVSLTW